MQPLGQKQEVRESRKRSKAGSEEMREERSSIGRQGSGVCWVGVLVVATTKYVSTLMLLVMMSLYWKTYPLPSSLALREKMLAKENMIDEENIVVKMGIDAVIRITIAGDGWCLRWGVCRINSKRRLCWFKIWLV